MCRTQPRVTDAASRAWRRLSAAVVLALGCGSAAFGVELGWPRSAPVFGQPLDIVVPLRLAGGEAPLHAGCVQVSPVEPTTDPQFFPRNALVAVRPGSDGHIRIASTSPVTEPIVEFRLSIGCDVGVARDFLLLSDAPGKLLLPPAAPVRVGTEGRDDILVEAGLPVAAKQSVSPPTDDGNDSRLVRLGEATSLNIIARRAHPADRQRRDDFRRAVAVANPLLFGGIEHVGAVPLPAGTALLMPAGTHAAAMTSPDAGQRQIKSPGGLMNVGLTGEVSESEAPSPRAAGSDRLRVGGSTGAVRPAQASMRPLDIGRAIERIERMVEDQGRTEVQLVESVGIVNQAFVEMKDFVTTLDGDQRKLQRAHKALERRFDSLPEPTRSPGLLEILGLILVAGMVGFGLIMLNHRLHVARIALQPAPVESPPPPPRRVVEPKPSLSFL